MKRHFYFILLALILSACTGAPVMQEQLPTPKVETGLTIWMQSTNDVTGFQILLDDFTRKTGEPVSLVVPLNEIQLASAFSGEKFPDVLILDGVEMVHYYASAGYLSMITGVNTRSIFPVVLNQCQINGGLYCVPWTSNFYTLYWNKDLFEAAGLEPDSSPETLEHLVEYADKLTRFGLEGQLEQVGFLPDFPKSNLWIYAYLHGGYWYSQDLAQLTVNNQPVLDALLWESQFYTKYDSELVSVYKSNSGENLFYNGSVAMLIAPAGMIFPEDMDVGVSLVPFPGDALERAGTFLFDGKTIVTPKAADKQKVRKFLEWAISPEISAQIACGEKNFPNNSQSSDDSCYSDQLEVGNYIPMLQSAIGYVRYSTPASSELETVLGQVEQQVLSSGSDPGPLLEQIQVQLEAQFREMMNP
jgi:multiple sugar transport system substrate-binding protein